MAQEWYEQYLSDGFTEEQIADIWQDTLYFRNEMSQRKEEREITSSTYIRAQKNLDRHVSDWIGKR